MLAPLLTGGCAGGPNLLGQQARACVSLAESAYIHPVLCVIGTPLHAGGRSRSTLLHCSCGTARTGMNPIRDAQRVVHFRCHGSGEVLGRQVQAALAALSLVPAMASDAELPGLAALRGAGAGSALQQQVPPRPSLHSYVYS